MKKFNKIVALLLMLTMLLPLAACGGSKGGSSSGDSAGQPSGGSDAAASQPSGEYGKSTADATGDVTADAIKKVLEMVKPGDVPYEDIREALGSDGIALTEDPEGWNDEWHTYRWGSLDSDYLQLTFQVSGGEELSYGYVSNLM